MVALVAQCSRDLAPDVVLQISHVVSAVTELTQRALHRTGFLAVFSFAPRLIVSLQKASDFVECPVEVAEPVTVAMSRRPSRQSGWTFVELANAPIIDLNRFHVWCGHDRMTESCSVCTHRDDSAVCLEPGCDPCLRATRQWSCSE